MANGVLIGLDYIEFRKKVIKFNEVNRHLFVIDKRDKVLISYIPDGLKTVSDCSAATGNIVVKTKMDLTKYSVMKLKLKNIGSVQTTPGYEPRFGVMSTADGPGVNSNSGAYQNGFSASIIIGPDKTITEYTLNIESFTGVRCVGFVGPFSATIVEFSFEQ